jgi:hypothetical protein
MIASTSPAASVPAGMEIRAISARAAMSLAVTVGRHGFSANAATAAT